ncbi:hypothetical protein GGX14DRAFT_384293 [Mycena pura]|uniref:Uncharacterized protein n=1 Tax=Mycena pura TaxID=153505 RepID=A0AAD6YV03_9AGAR|nr:hypothetical protein GGX14DRAFT_384293 [Mycena pura]
MFFFFEYPEFGQRCARRWVYTPLLSQQLPKEKRSVRPAVARSGLFTASDVPVLLYYCFSLAALLFWSRARRPGTVLNDFDFLLRRHAIYVIRVLLITLAVSVDHDLRATCIMKSDGMEVHGHGVRMTLGCSQVRLHVRTVTDKNWPGMNRDVVLRWVPKIRPTLRTPL